MSFENDCPEAIWGRHSEPNSRGRCVYCGKFLYKVPKPNLYDPNWRDERQDYYDMYYTPDGPE